MKKSRIVSIKKKILIVNCYFDELRFPVQRRTKVPQAMGPAFLAGAFSEDLCEIKLYNEQYSGPLEDEKIFSFPDMLVLTGLNTAFDRMLHLTAYARTKNPKVIVVVGGPAIRSLPRYSKRFFDYCCTGDIEQLGDVIEATFGHNYISKNLIENKRAIPRYDLTYWMRMGGYVESTRNCYFNCNFCSLTAENNLYQQYDLKYLHQQFKAFGSQKLALFIDNNFGGTSKQSLHDRISFVKKAVQRGYFKNWMVMVSEDFLSDANLDMVYDAGCIGIFSGVESFDNQSLHKFNKSQNTRLPQVNAIKKCLSRGIAFSYGLIMDLSSRTLFSIKKELAFIFNTPEIPLPAYISIAVPILKTPFFYECVSNHLLLPNIKLRDMDSTTLTLKPIDPIEKVVPFIKQIQNFSGYRKKIFRHAVNFFRRYGKNFPVKASPYLMSGPLLLTSPRLSTLGLNFIPNGLKNHSRTFVGSTESLDSVYKPAFCIDSRFAEYFNPTMLTGSNGQLNEALIPDLIEDDPALESVAI